jgi:uncharacterized protein (DUF58 family)
MFDWRWFRRPRHPLARVAFALLAALTIAAVLVLGFFALLAFAVIGAIVALLRALLRASAGAAVPARAQVRVIEGEYVVLRNDGPRQA